MDKTLQYIQKNPRHIFHITSKNNFHDFNLIYHALKVNALSWHHMASKIKYHKKTLKIIVENRYLILDMLPNDVINNNNLMKSLILIDPQYIIYLYNKNNDLVKLLLLSVNCSKYINHQKLFLGMPLEILNDKKMMTIIYSNIRPLNIFVDASYHKIFSDHLLNKAIVNKNIIFAIYCKQAGHQQKIDVLNYISQNYLLIRFIHKKFNKDKKFILWVAKNCMTKYTQKLFIICISNKIKPFKVPCDKNASNIEKIDTFVFYFMINFIHDI